MRLTRNIHSFITPFGVESVFTAVLSSSAACYARPQVRLFLLLVAAPAACCAARNLHCSHRTAQAVLKPYLELFLRDELVAWQVPPGTTFICPVSMRARPRLAAARRLYEGGLLSLRFQPGSVVCVQARPAAATGTPESQARPSHRLSLAPERHFGIKSAVAIACRSRRRRYRRLSRRTSAQSSNGARASCPCRVVILGS